MDKIFDKYISSIKGEKKDLIRSDINRFSEFIENSIAGKERALYKINIQDVENDMILAYIGDYLLWKVSLNNDSYVSILVNLLNYYKFIKNENIIDSKKYNNIEKIFNYYIAVIPDIKSFRCELNNYIKNSFNYLNRCKNVCSSFVEIERIEKNILWLYSFKEKKEIGPFVLLKNITKYARIGFSFEAEYTISSGNYYFIFAGNVYPEGAFNK